MSYFSKFPFGGKPPQQNHQNPNNPHKTNLNKKFYDVLGISQSATISEINKAYYNLSKMYTPDKDPEKYNEIKEAYQTLSDPQKRQNYDKHGNKGFKEKKSTKKAQEQDILNMFFNNLGSSYQQKIQIKKVKSTRRVLQVTLENIYNGEILQISHKRMKCCELCQGKGGSEIRACNQCKGKGMIIHFIELGFGILQQIHEQCKTCKGDGKIIEQKFKCRSCKGEKVISKQEIIEVPIEKGSITGEQIIIPNKGDQQAGYLTGDLVFQLSEKNHPVFKRIGADLTMKKIITLTQCLCGFQYTLNHLDGGLYTIKTNKNEIIAASVKKIIRQLGMPFYKNSDCYGNLIIQFQVEMPKAGSLTNQDIQALSKILPGKIKQNILENDVRILQNFDEKDLNTNQQGGKKLDQQQKFSQGQRIECNPQ